MCQEVGTQSKETVKLKFLLYLSRVDFFVIGVIFSVMKHVCEKSVSFVSLFNFSDFPLHFPS